jgi:uncharacterized protein (DUF3820 family)
MVMRAELLYGHILRLQESGIAPNVITDEVVEIIRSLFKSLSTFSEGVHYRGSVSNAYQAHTPLLNQEGRPRYDLPQEQLTYFIEKGFTCTKICSMLGVSLSTIRRRMKEYGLTIRGTYSQISNAELNIFIQRGYTLFPNAGYRFLLSWLNQQGIRVQEYRVRQSIREIDPIGVANRWLTCIKRRTYSVSGPQALWHLDGNHKLIRWRLVIHGAIDGYSRTAVYLRCSDNNRAQTVLNLFKEAVEEYSLPTRIRTDKGVENYDVAMYMLTHPERGPSMNPVIVGKSVHNQRIERLWRDIYQGVTCTYYFLFYHLEDIGVLNSLSEADLFCLHYVYIPVINHHLQEWMHCWNNHKMSSCHGKSPSQLWIEGLQKNCSVFNNSIVCSSVIMFKIIFNAG